MTSSVALALGGAILAVFAVAFLIAFSSSYTEAKGDEKDQFNSDRFWSYFGLTFIVIGCVGLGLFLILSSSALEVIQ